MTPIACCKFEGSLPSISLIDEQCAIVATDLNNNMKTGCVAAITGELDSFNNIIVGVLAGILVFQAILVVIVICLIVLNNKEDNKVV